MARPAPSVKFAPTPPETLAHEFVNIISPVANALAIIGMVAGADPEVARALKVMDRQVEAMKMLAARMQVADGDNCGSDCGGRPPQLAGRSRSSSTRRRNQVSRT